MDPRLLRKEFHDSSSDHLQTGSQGVGCSLKVTKTTVWGARCLSDRLSAAEPLTLPEHLLSSPILSPLVPASQSLVPWCDMLAWEL